MAQHRIYHINDRINITPILLVVFIAQLSLGTSSLAVDLPPELPLWDKLPQDYAVGYNVKEQLRLYKARPGCPSGLNRVFSSVSSPTYSIHRPKKPNGVGLVICPGGGFRDVWLDREGHDLAIWLKDHNVTSLVLKYRTRVSDGNDWTPPWQEYQRAVQADGRQAIRILRTRASDLGLQPNKIGICGFSAGGHLAISCALRTSSSHEIRPELTHKITRGDPIVTVTEQGTLESSDNTEIKCKVRGQNTIIWVIERIREIGIRRALGAKRLHIIQQFLTETVVLSAGGGLLGVLFGLLCGPLFRGFRTGITMISPDLLPPIVYTLEPRIAPWSVVLSLIISLGVGIVFGIYPTRQAAYMDPIEALRHE